MSDWLEVQTRIPDAVQKILGKRFDVGWTDREARWRDKSHCRLKVVSQVNLGRTELRRSDNGDGTFTERVYSPARLTVQFTFVAQDQDLYESALPDAEAVAASLRRTDAFEELCEAGLGISEVGPLIVSDFRDEHGRIRSSVTFEVRFNTHVSVATGFNRTGDYVEQVEVTGDPPAYVFVDGS